MWRPFLLASASAMTLAGSALAADLTPVPPPPPVFTWTGLYLGGYGGGEVTNTSYNTVLGTPLAGISHLTPTDIAVVDAAGSQTLDKGGFTAGAELGYNWQVGMFVLGFETDVGGVTGGTHAQSAGFIHGTDVLPPTLVFPFGISQSVSNGLFGTVRGRIGVAFDRFLIYGTGGLAYSSGHYAFNYADGLFPATGAAVANVKVGYAVGGGLEYGLTNNWSVKGEFLYSQFGRVTTSGVIVNTASPAFTNPFVTSERIQNYTARVALNYRFNWFAPPPVVAKY
ncbi:MAG TPA: outer membrane beta-barrel protein [Methylocella sp.]|nr:outer membrane beta-barrel protein [Methylocella sp.]